MTGTSKGISDFRSTLPRFTPGALKANQSLINLLSSIAERKQATPAHIAIPWLRAVPGVARAVRKFYQSHTAGG